MTHTFLDKEVGWLRFNERVLYEGERDEVPLLERVNFSNIFHSNLDEFFMKRVGRLKAKHNYALGKDPRYARELDKRIEEIHKVVEKLCERNKELIEKKLVPQLKKKEIELLKWAKLSQDELKWADKFFQDKVFPVLTPMAVDKGHPFPLISNLSFSLAVELKNPVTEEALFARIKIPDVFPNWILLPKKKGSRVLRFVSMIDVVRNHLDTLFPGMSVQDTLSFQVTRSLEVEEHEADEDAEDLLELIAEEIKQRRFSEVTRLEVESDQNTWLLGFLMDELDLREEDVLVAPVPLEFKRMDAIAALKISSLRYPQFQPTVPLRLRDADRPIFDAIKEGDVLVHHPFESFESTVERFVNEAADDPDVVSIKMTLYRAGSKSGIIDALKRASLKGKQVVCLIELKARLDEARNISWAKVLEDEGIHVVYGMMSLKTHAKLTLVVRRERNVFTTYAHIGTGNYNPQTARFYTDLGILTSDRALCNELTEVFHYLTGRSLKDDYDHALVSPITMKDRFLELIEREASFANKGKPSRIIAKFNNFDDTDIIKALYKASQAGVKITLIVRGFSKLAPGVKGMSENIEVISVIGRLLEHSRIFYFRNAQKNPADGDVFLGSADWMKRNLHRRVEVIVPVYSKEAKQTIYDYLNLVADKKSRKWRMKGSGEYVLESSSPVKYHCHDELITQYENAGAP